MDFESFAENKSEQITATIAERRHELCAEHTVDVRDVADENNCQRCGDCCREIGRNFWRFAYNGEKFPNRILKSLALKTMPDYSDNHDPCFMLEFDADGLAVCLIEKYFGRDAKPKVCREYDGENRCKKDQDQKAEHGE